MSRTSRSVPLSAMTGGINRYETEAKQNQTTDALDVLADKGDLRRRDAFAAFAMAAPHFLPAGIVYVKVYDYSAQTWTEYSARNPNLATLGLNSNDKRLFIGCDEQFEGVDFGQINKTISGTASFRYAYPMYVIDDWVDSASVASDSGYVQSMLWHGDTTGPLPDNAGTYTGSHSTGSKGGHIWWHKNSKPSEWDTKRTVDSVSAYWITIGVYTEKRAPEFSGGSGTPLVDWDSRAGQVLTPGIRCFNLKPVTGIYPLTSRQSTRFITASGIGERERGQETGGPQLGNIFSTTEPTHFVGIEKDWGSGFVGTYDTSGWPTGWTGGSVGPGTDLVRKTDTSYNWLVSNGTGTSRTNNGSWGYPVLLAAPTITSTDTSVVDITYASYTNEFEDCIVLVTAAGSGGVTAGRYNRVATSTRLSSTATRLTFNAAWDGTITTNTTIYIFGIPHQCELRYADSNYNLDLVSSTIESQRQAWYEIAYTSASSAHEIFIAPTGSDGNFIGDRYDPANYSGNNKPIAFKIVKESRYELPDNYSPDYTFDEVTKTYVFAFGNYPLQFFDGANMRKLAAKSNPLDPVVEAWQGSIVEKLAGSGDTLNFAGNAFLRSDPPRGRFIRSFLNRLFVAGLDDDPSKVVYSAPGAYNDLWPKENETTVRDPHGNAITGMEVFNNELVVFTANSIYGVSTPDEAGYVNLVPRSRGIGFASNRTVQRAPFGGADVLLGANADGIYAYTGAEPVIILDEWDRVLDGGINTAHMDKACSAVSYYENAYYLAVPGVNAAYPNRLIRYCWEDRTLYVFTAPFGGITAMAVDRDALGNEVLVFGHEDGTLSTFAPNVTDDGETITGRAKTQAIQLNGNTLAPTGYLATMGDTSSVQNVIFYEYINGAEGEETTVYTGTFDGGSEYVAESTGSLAVNTDTIVNNKRVTKKLFPQANSRGESVQLEISGTGRWVLRSLALLFSPKGQRS